MSFKAAVFRQEGWIAWLEVGLIFKTFPSQRWTQMFSHDPRLGSTALAYNPRPLHPSTKQKQTDRKSHGFKSWDGRGPKKKKMLKKGQKRFEYWDLQIKSQKHPGPWPFILNISLVLTSIKNILETSTLLKWQTSKKQKSGVYVV